MVVVSHGPCEQISRESYCEADSLFAKRTEVRSSNDRYANLEVNYLLQKMEDFEGITILTTNNFEAIDDAFKRRIRFKVYFPNPDRPQRLKIWRQMIPSEANVVGPLNFDHVVEYEFSPSHIKNAVLRAALLAAASDEPLTQTLLDQGADQEAKELGLLVRTVNEYY